MALSIGRLGAVSTTSVMAMQPQSYGIQNQSAVSTAYEESIQQLGSGASVDGVHPVQYPKSQLVANRVSQIEDSQRMEQAYNSIATAFEGNISSYDQSMMGMSYASVGANIDTFA